METFTPVRGMICCANETGNYVKKEDYDAVKAKLAQSEKEHLESVALNASLSGQMLGERLYSEKLEKERDALQEWRYKVLGANDAAFESDNEWLENLMAAINDPVGGE